MAKKSFPYRETGEKLKKLRGDISKTVYAKKLGIPYQTYLRYETGERETPARFLDQARMLSKRVVEEEPAVAEEQSSYAPQPSSSPYIEKVAAMMAEMDIETQKDICLSVEKEKLLRDLLRQAASDKKAG
jgi:hypothetical protein